MRVEHGGQILIADLDQPRRPAAIRLLRESGLDVREERVTRDDLYVADEIFCVGTAAEVSAINSVDDRAVPCPGPITKQVADLYGRAVRGQVPQYKKYCELA